jgi:flagellar basal body-associated protein FliL
MKSEILKFIAFIVNLIIAVGVAVLAGAYYVSRKVANCKAADAKEKPPAPSPRSQTLGAILVNTQTFKITYFTQRAMLRAWSYSSSDETLEIPGTVDYLKRLPTSIS